MAKPAPHQPRSATVVRLPAGFRRSYFRPHRTRDQPRRGFTNRAPVYRMRGRFDSGTAGPLLRFFGQPDGGGAESRALWRGATAGGAAGSAFPGQLRNARRMDGPQEGFA